MTTRRRTCRACEGDGILEADSDTPPNQRVTRDSRRCDYCNGKGYVTDTRPAIVLAIVAIVALVGCTSPTQNGTVREAFEASKRTWCETQTTCQGPGGRPIVTDVDSCVASAADMYCLSNDCAEPYQEWPTLDECITNAMENPLCTRARCSL